MSITSDLRAYADSAVNKVAGNVRVSDITDRANDAVNDLRASAEKFINVDAVRTAVEPYLSQLRSYGDSVSVRVEEILSSLKNDPRVGKLVETADSLSTGVVELVQERVVKPVQSLTTGAAKPARKPSPRPASKPAATRPATRKPAAKTTARKAPAKRAGTSA